VIAAIHVLIDQTAMAAVTHPAARIVDRALSQLCIGFP
jgi:hypothetical protein